MPQGLQIWDASGNLIVDTSTYTAKETVYYSNSSVTSSTTINIGTALPENTEVLVINNSGDEETSDGLPSVTLNKSVGQITVSGSGSFDVQLRLCEL